MPAVNVIIGRQSGTNQLQVCGANDSVIGTIGQIGSVDNGVSRQHLKFSIDVKTLEVTISNVNPNNQTKVNGTAILSTKVEPNDKIELGMNSFCLDINSVVALLQLEGYLPKEYSIKHLEPVWNYYYETNRQIQIRLGRLNAILGVTGAFSMLAIIISLFQFNNIYLDVFRYMCYGIALISIIAACIIRFRGALANVKQKEALEEYIQQNYVCPNEQCHRFMGVQKYSLLLQNGKCPYCGSKFVE